ncbi:MAG: PAS domain-containing sensor histidine kinase [Bacteroidetes bacterium]|nr:PAS domain-containing sensor histidine kinase [Bacteroidota bacterium]
MENWIKSLAKVNSKPTRTSKDLIIISVSLILVSLFVELFGVFDIFQDWIRELSFWYDWRIHDKLFILVLLAVALGVFTYRRSRDLKREISERKLVEKSLSESYEFNNTLLRTIPFGMDIVDVEGNVLFLNEKLKMLFGEKAIGKKCWELYCDDKTQCQTCPLKKGLEIGENAIIEHQKILGGKTFEVHHSAMIFQGNKAILEIFLDITERKQRQEEYETIIRTAMDGFWLTDIEGRLLHVNDAYCHLTEYSREELLNMSIRDLDANEVPDDISKHIRRVIETGYDRFESKHKCKCGRLIDVEISVNYSDISGGRLVAFIRDITERKLIELQLQKYFEDLKASNAAKDKLFSIIAHDLKSPFNAIIGFSEILIDRVRSKDYSDISIYADIILNSSKGAMDLLKNLLDWSLSQTGRIEFNPEYFEISELINKTIHIMTSTAMQKSIIITKKLPQKATIYADKNMIRTVLRNLISNAIKFTHPDGTITISAKEDQNALKISVTDTGIGIPSDYIDKLFHIDNTYSTVGTQKEKGTGLGLTLCNEFIEKHGGKIWVESIVGEGSAFSFTLPKYNN